ncbi:MAG: FAD-dependent oxidoreductase [Gammaproteobacteria bacterium]|nr:FAD-dependent oxidoreductase [Gammaproteobacteria bacterium]
MSEYYDIGIIGGGIQGCGIAQAAAAAGYRTVLLERDLPAVATSSRSSKLIHGGLRYLETGQFSLVRQSLRERELLASLAPHLIRHVAFYIPIYTNTSRRGWQIFSGLSLYALLGSFKKYAGFRRIATTQWEKLDALKTQDLQAVYQYWDAQTDDAKLTRAVMHSATKLGARLLCPAQVDTVHYQSGEYHVAYSHGRTSGIIRCVALINAAGPWVQRVHASIKPYCEFPEIELVQGTHIVLQQPAPSGVYYLESPSDRRAVFVMPWYGKTLVGTTEQLYNGDPAQVQPSAAEIEYLRAIARHYFPSINDTVESQFAGLRVLPKSAQSIFQRPRDTLLFTAPTLPGYVALVGGKLTGYRATALKVLQVLKRILPWRAVVTQTALLALELAPGDTPPFDVEVD